MVYQLIYFSIANENVDQGDVDDIVAIARACNPLHGVTGFLSFNGSEFLQYIEGPEPAIRTLMGNIEADHRHNSVLLLHSGLARERSFPDWSMHQLPPVKRGRLPTMPQEALKGVAEALPPRFRLAFIGYCNS